MKVEESLADFDFNFVFRYFSNPNARSYIIFEHNYCTPANANEHEDDAKGTIKYLLTNPHLNDQSPTSSSPGDDLLDVVSVDNEISLCGNSEAEKTEIEFVGNDEIDWTEKIDKKNWTTTKQQLFRNIVNILETDYLSRMANEGLPNSLVKRRLMSNKTAVRMRRLFTSISWNTQLLQWLHGLLMDNLPQHFISTYQDALQCLETKVQPHLVDNITSLSRSRFGGAETHNKKLWDPYSDVLNQKKPAKLSGGPLLIIVPFNTGNGFPANSRPHRWMTEFSHLSTVVTVTCSKNNVSSGSLDINTLLGQMIRETRLKMAELRADYPYKPIVLLGIDSGSAIACHVATIEKVAAVVCLGFPLFTTEGKRGEPNDKLLEQLTPILFVIGQNATTASTEEMQSLRARMKCTSSLIVVGGADDHLRTSHYLRMKKSVTQSVVDRCILNEVGKFLNRTLSTPPPPAPAPKQVTTTTATSSTFIDDSKIKRDKLSHPSTQVYLKKILTATPVKKPRVMYPKRIDHDPNKDPMNVGYGISVANNIAAPPEINVPPTHAFATNKPLPLYRADPVIFASFDKINTAARHSSSIMQPPNQQQPQQQSSFTNMEFIAQSGSPLYGITELNKPSSVAPQPPPKKSDSASFITVSTEDGTVILDPPGNKVSRARKDGNVEGRVKRPYVRRTPLEKRKRNNKPIPMTSLVNASMNRVNIGTNSLVVGSDDVETITVLPQSMTSSISARTTPSGSNNNRSKNNNMNLTPKSILDLPVVFADDNELNSAVSNIPTF